MFDHLHDTVLMEDVFAGESHTFFLTELGCIANSAQIGRFPIDSAVSFALLALFILLLRLSILSHIFLFHFDLYHCIIDTVFVVYIIKRILTSYYILI